MSRIDLDPTQRLVDVNWDTPEMRDLLRKTEHLHLDNRHLVNKYPIFLRLGWHTSAPANAAVWVDLSQTDGQRVVLTDFPLEPGDPVMLEIRQAGLRGESLVYAEVLSCRRGQRVGDNGLFVLVLRDLKRPPLLTSG
jgi:hypothetical protein